MKFVILILCTLALTACGGGGNNSAVTPVVTPVVTPLFTISDLQDYPTVSHYDYGSVSIVFGKFGSSTANCFLTQVVTRGSLGSSPTYPDGPTYVYCQQSDGSFKEVSQQLFGQQLSVNGGYPLIADFNGDGIDDIFLVQSWDGYFPNATSNVYALISKSDGTYLVNKIDSLYTTGLYGLTAIDINQDGCLDVVVASTDLWRGDCTGNFSQTRNAFDWTQVGVSNTYRGEAIASADFLGKGYNQLMIVGPSSAQQTHPNALIDIDKNLKVLGIYKLPMPYFTATLGAGSDDDPAVRVIDINNDGNPDVIIQTTNFFYVQAHPGTQPLTKYQLYINNNNGSFTDISDTALPGFATNIISGYDMRIVDLNGDGYPDIAFDGASYGNGAIAGNQVWINDKDNTFKPYFTTELDTLSNQFTSQFGSVPANTVGIMLPIKVNTTWNYILHVRDSKGYYHDGVANTQYTFK